MTKPKPDLAAAVKEAASNRAKPANAGPTKGLLLRVPVELHRRLRQLALDEGESLQSLGLDALEQILEHHERRRQ